MHTTSRGTVVPLSLATAKMVSPQPPTTVVVLLAESRPGEQRVALTPEDCRLLLSSSQNSCRVLVESTAGDSAGFSDAEYIEAGGSVISGGYENVFRAAFSGSGDLVFVRCKRAVREREVRERDLFAELVPGEGSQVVLLGFMEVVCKGAPCSGARCFLPHPSWSHLPRISFHVVHPPTLSLLTYL